MQPPARSPDESERIRALLETGLLDSPPEERFDRLTRLARQMLRVPIAAVTLVDSDRQWFKSRQGIDLCETSRDISFCGHAILAEDMFMVPDAHEDPRFADNPLVVGPPNICFYAGAPLSTRSGHRIGTLCVFSDVPRHLTQAELSMLRDLADCVEAEINQLDLTRQSEALVLAQGIGNIISRAQSQFIQEEDRHKAFDVLLDEILALTASEYGFVGEILRRDDGTQVLKTYAITNIALDLNSQASSKKYPSQVIEFETLTALFGAAISSGEPLIANDSVHDGLRLAPPHCPVLKAVLGVPVHYGGEMLAMFVLANRPGGYDQKLVNQLQPLVATIGQLVHAAHIQEQHEQARAELARLSRVASETTNGVVISDAMGQVQWVNEGFTRLTGYTLSEMLGKKPGQILQGHETDPMKIGVMHAALSRSEGFEVDVVNYTKDRKPYLVHISCSPFRGPDGLLQGYMAIQSDITEQRNSEIALRQFKSTLDHTLDCVFMFDSKNLKFFYANDGALRQVGYEQSEFFEMHPFDIKPEYPPDRFREMIAPLISGEQESLTFDTVHRHKSGSLVPVEVFLQHMSYPYERSHFVAIVRDITERKQNEERLRHLATHDSLTGLPNRTLFQDRLSHELASAKRKKTQVGVLLLDLDNFKAVNDSFGHQNGDILLMEVATRLSCAMRAGDTVARLGGDEYALMMVDVESALQVRGAAERLLEVLNQPILIDGREIIPAASIGYCIYPTDGIDSDTLIRHADTAMYAAKTSGRGAANGYQVEMSNASKDHLDILSRLRIALANGDFKLFYQPQVDMATGLIVGAEALLRWDDAELGSVSPVRFIPVAEATGLILPIGDWVLDKACKQIAYWRSQGLEMPVAINLSPYQFRQTELVEKIKDACLRHGCPAHLLELEITESAAMQSPEMTNHQVSALADAGFSLALDDFGTGYSSLARLGQLRVNKIKIDRSFIVEIPGNPIYEALVRTTITLGNEMGMKLVAEGVETQEQQMFLARYGCTAYQGWLYSKAIPADDFMKLVHEVVV